MASLPIRAATWLAFEAARGMPTPLGRGATHKLTRLGLVLSHPSARRAWLARGVLLLAGLATGAAGGYFYADEHLGAAQQQAVAAQDQQRLRQQLEQSQLNLRVTEARSQELERQIAALVQQLRESQEELTFFRKARDGKH
jgi:uncharacterized protein HemX